MITITKEISLNDFEAWGPAEAKLATLRESPEKLEYVEELISEIMPSCTEMELNDYLSFDEEIDEIVEEIELHLADEEAED